MSDPFEIIELEVDQFGVETLDGQQHVLLLGWTRDRHRLAAYADIESLQSLIAFVSTFPEEELVVAVQRRQLAGHV